MSDTERETNADDKTLTYAEQQQVNAQAEAVQREMEEDIRRQHVIQQAGHDAEVKFGDKAPWYAN